MTGTAVSDSAMKLHEAIDAVLAERPGMTYREIAHKIKTRRLYLKRDGLPAEAGQINARVKTERYRERYCVDDDKRVFPA